MAIASADGTDSGGSGRARDHTGDHQSGKLGERGPVVTDSGKWYKFESEANRKALLRWALENRLKVTEVPGANTVLLAKMYPEEFIFG
jgi:hypothetical protein